MSKRDLAARALSFLPRRLVVARRERRLGRCLTVLTYHRVMEIPAGFPLDDDLVSAGPRAFERQLAFVTREYDVMTLREVGESLDRDGRLPARGLVITFDDGYRDNYEVAFPLLRRANATAVMFVAAGFIGERRLFWWDRLARIVKTAPAGEVPLGEPLNAVLRLGSGNRQQAARKLIRAVKGLPDDEKEELIAFLAERCGVADGPPAERETMTWNELRELDAAGIEIGAHSVNHPIFSNIPETRLREEVAGAKAMIEAELGRAVTSFGSPGRGRIGPKKKRSAKETLRRIVAESGYRFSTMYNWGLNTEKGFDPLGLRRVGIERYDSGAVFRAKLLFPDIIDY
ncbi:MAG: polysaccharide deacetylase family protein [Candidatus Krumholzibacteriota bacterium]|nr:polysaccharide deacetylase family protein [Candidatus Krumholzibacteriota bacterium]